MKSNLLKYFVLFILISGIIKGENMKEGFVDVIGGKIWYKVVGENTASVPLLLIHGGPGAPHDYMENLEKLGDERQVILYDQLGCGFSDRPVDTTLWNMKRFSDEISKLLEHLHIKEVNLLGQSWGSMLAVYFYLNQSEVKINKLILSGPFLNAKMFAEDVTNMVDELPEDDKNIIKECENKGDYANAKYQEVMNKFYSLHVCRINPFPECMNRTFEKMGLEVYSFMWGASEFSIFGTLKDADLTDKLNLITIPVLLTCGEYDEVSPKTTFYYASKIENAKVEIFKDASHMHHLEKEDEYLKAVNEFLKK